MSALLRRFTEASRPSAVAKIFYQFSGTLEEDPVKFAEALEKYFSENDIREDREMISLFRAQLSGDARRWIDSFKNVQLNYVAVRNIFLQKFDSPDCKARANISFFGDKQSDKESAEVFLSRKRQLMERLQPNINTATAIGILTTLLLPEVGLVLRGARPTTLDELLVLASNVEQGISRGRRSGAPPPRNGPATPCRFCQAWHYHSECPQNPYASSGNWREPGGASRRSAPPADETGPAVNGRQENSRVQTRQTSNNTMN